MVQPGTGEPRPVSVRRTPTGWVVDPDGAAEHVEDLLSALTLADLLAAETPAAERLVRGEPTPHDELAALRQQVSQLERALVARVSVEQAIGVLAERHRIAPRAAFEQLRSVARRRGARVLDLARDVVASTSADGSGQRPGHPLPPELR